MPLSDEDIARIATLIQESEVRTLNRIEGRLDALEVRLKDHTAQATEKTETGLLTAFHEWASPTDQKIRSHREALRALDLQIEEIAGRVAKLEAAADTRH